ncbi:MAG: aspartate carbamoyltransferase catalytic subunit [Erysipelotrichaceae bacterium]|nr:aspartate carbamoyltransferase catalytic subunit [Erysipelotrichaceae bacterium]
MNKNSLLSMRDLSAEEIMAILNDALLFDGKYQDWQLPCRKALVANLFYENSTRTHYSFESAELQLGCKVADVAVSQSSVSKGETLYDTVKTLEAVGYDAVVIRHPQDAYYKELKNVNIPILNGGDGAGDHPTQCLLDLLTMYKEFGTLKGLNVVICGDILHSRVAASNKEALEKLGSTVRFAGPKEWQREGFPVADLDEVISEVDVVMMLRIQRERGAALKDMGDDESYLEKYGLSKARYAKLKEGAIVMHPAPVNRGVEIDSDLVEAEKSRIFPQMSNGVLVRKAVIKRAFGFESFE